MTKGDDKELYLFACSYLQWPSCTLLLWQELGTTFPDPAPSSPIKGTQWTMLPHQKSQNQTDRASHSTLGNPHQLATASSSDVPGYTTKFLDTSPMQVAPLRDLSPSFGGPSSKSLRNQHKLSITLQEVQLSTPHYPFFQFLNYQHHLDW